MKRIIKFHETLFHQAKSSMKILFHQSVMKILLIMTNLSQISVRQWWNKVSNALLKPLYSHYSVRIVSRIFVKSLSKDFRANNIIWTSDSCAPGWELMNPIRSRIALLYFDWVWSSTRKHSTLISLSLLRSCVAPRIAHSNPVDMKTIQRLV